MLPSVQVDAVTALLGGKNAHVQDDDASADGDGGQGAAGRRQRAGDAHADAGGDGGDQHDDAGDESADGAGGDPEAGGQVEQPYTLKELAAKLEVPAKALYELEIPIGEGKHVALGEMKTQYLAGQAAIAEVEQVRQVWDERERELMVDRHRVGQILQALGPHIPAQALAMLQESQAEARERERQAVLRTIPGWSKPEQQDADIKVMLGMLKYYGFSQRDLDAVGDHKLVKLLYDYGRIWERAKQLKTNPPARNSARQGQNVPAPRAAPTSNGLRTVLERAKAQNASRSDKLAGISALLG